MKRSPMKQRYRTLQPGEPLPAGEPKRYKNDRGYVRLRWLVGVQEYVEVYEHRLIAGLPDCEVHHRDHSKDNNDPSNLVPLSKTDHAHEHGREWAARSRRVTEWGGYRSQQAYDKARRGHQRRERQRERDALMAELYDAGKTTIQIAAEFGIDPSNVTRGVQRARSRA